MRQLKITKSITNRESASLDKYLQEIGREDLITVEEEVELAQRIRKGDRVALEKLTRANLRFVVSVAKQYQNQGLSLPDLINEGNLGLIKAAEKFDETRGFKFISYAVWWIRQSILQALAEQSRIVRLPLNQVEGEDNSLLDVLVNDDSPMADRSLVNESLAREIDRALSTLTDREKEIIQMFFGIGQQEMTLEEIGDKFGLTRERVRQIKEKAIRRLRQSNRSKLLKSKSVLISLVLIVLGAGMVAYAKCAASSSDSVPVKVEQRLREKAQAGKAYCDKNGCNTNYCFLVDFSIHSGKRRFFVWDFKGDSVKYASLCAHGYGIFH